jgi:Chloride channel protein EriC
MPSCKRKSIWGKSNNVLSSIFWIVLLQSLFLESFQFTSPFVVVLPKRITSTGNGNQKEKEKPFLSLMQLTQKNNAEKDKGKIETTKDAKKNINGIAKEPTQNTIATAKTKPTRSKVWNTTIFPVKEFGKGQQSLPSFLGMNSSTSSSSTSSSNPAVPPKTTTTTITTAAAAAAAASTATSASTCTNDIPSSSFPTMIQKEMYTQLIAGMIGGFTGMSIAGFKLSIEGIREFCYGGSLNFISPQDEIVPYYMIPVLGAVGVTLLSLTGDFSPGLKGVVKEVDGYSLMTVSSSESSSLHDATSISPWTWRPIRKALAAIVTLGTGNSLGPEGPGVEIGAAISRIGMSIWPFQTSYQNQEEIILLDKKAAMDGYDEKKNDVGHDSLVERITRNRLLLACGAAAGVSSGFNAPLSGVFFALEVVQSSLPLLQVPPVPSTTAAAAAAAATAAVPGGNDTNRSDKVLLVAMEPKSLSASSGSIAAILISSVVAALVARLFLGDELALHLLTYEISTPLSELPLYILLGSFCGVVSVAFSQAAKFFKALFEGNAGPKVAQDIFGALPAPLLPLLGGAVSGGVGYFYPQILFFGYETLNGLLQNENLPTVVLLSLLLAKMTTTAVSAGSGLVGGILAPSLFLGGMTGAAFHNVVCQTFMGLSMEETIVGPSGMIFDLAGVPIYSSVGAASVLAAIFRAPLTASLLLFEITRNYDVLLPILASAGIATLSSDILENRIESKS